MSADDPTKKAGSPPHPAPAATPLPPAAAPGSRSVAEIAAAPVDSAAAEAALRELEGSLSGGSISGKAEVADVTASPAPKVGPTTPPAGAPVVPAKATEERAVARTAQISGGAPVLKPLAPPGLAMPSSR